MGPEDMPWMRRPGVHQQPTDAELLAFLAALIRDYEESDKTPEDAEKALHSIAQWSMQWLDRYIPRLWQERGELREKLAEHDQGNG